MTLSWHREDSPRWDLTKQSFFGPDELAAAGLSAPDAGAVVANEWWHVEDDGQVVGYGWLDSEWGDAQIGLAVAEAARNAGVGSFVVDRLEHEAAARGLNYIYNVVPAGHPDPQGLRAWLLDRGFRAAERGELRRRVTVTAG